MKNNLYRFSYIFFNLLLISLDIFFLYKIIPLASEKVLHIITLLSLILFEIFQIYLIFKGFLKKNEDFIIHDLVYENNGSINKPPLIIANILLVLGVSLTITFICLIFILPSFINESYVLVSIFLLLVVDTAYYDLYILLHHLKSKDIYKLIK